MSPDYIEAAPLNRIAYWHRRLVGFAERRAAALDEQRAWDDEITKAVRRLPRR